MKFQKSMEFDLIRKIIKQITELNLNIAIIKMNLELFWLEIMIFLSCLWKSVSKWSYLKSTLVDIFAQYINVDWLLSKLESVVFSFLKKKRRIKDGFKNIGWPG